MLFLKKYTTPVVRIVAFVTLLLLFSCSSQKSANYLIEGKKLPVTVEYTAAQPIEDFIAPYRNHINKDLDSVLAYCPETMDKSKGRWQTTIGNLLADVTFAKADKLFLSREGKHIDICLLNHGGIRAPILQGYVTARTAFEVMPFENSLYIVALKGEQLKEIANYIVREKKPHPLSGMQFTISNSEVVNINVQGKPLDLNRTYYAATSDYLYNGGDKMDFFKKGTAVYDMDYKLRNLLIDYFKEADTLPVITTERIIEQP